MGGGEVNNSGKTTCAKSPSVFCHQFGSRYVNTIQGKKFTLWFWKYDKPLRKKDGWAMKCKACLNEREEEK